MLGGLGQWFVHWRPSAPSKDMMLISRWCSSERIMGQLMLATSSKILKSTLLIKATMDCQLVASAVDYFILILLTIQKFRCNVFQECVCRHVCVCCGAGVVECLREKKCREEDRYKCFCSYTLSLSELIFTLLYFCLARSQRPWEAQHINVIWNVRLECDLLPGTCGM